MAPRLINFNNEEILLQIKKMNDLKNCDTNADFPPLSLGIFVSAPVALNYN
jgi:hypothetical protein